MREKHPCKDPAGEALWDYKKPLYELHVDNVQMPGQTKPLTVNLLYLLEKTFSDETGKERTEPDTTELKYLLMAIMESGQRHDGVQGHGYDKPKFGVHACYRHDTRKNEVYCRYLFPRELRQFLSADRRGVIVPDPYRPDLRNLFLEWNDGLINNFEEHLLLANLGNIDWRPLLNLWSVMEYLTKYTSKAGKGSKHLGKLFEDVLDKVWQYEMEDGMHDLWRRTIMKFYNRILGDRDYSLFEVVHFGLRLLGVLSSFGDVRSASVSNWATLKTGPALERTAEHRRATNKSALEMFRERTNLKRPTSIHLDDLRDV